MILRIETPDKEKIVGALEAMPQDLKSAQRSANSSVGYMMTRKAKRWMASEGKGSWPKPHPLSRKYRTIGPRFSRGPRRFGKRKDKDTFLERAAKWTRYTYDERQVKTGFSFDTRPRRFDRKLEKLISEQERGYSIFITKKMQRYLALHGHPMRKNTVLRVPPRPITGPVTAQVKEEIYPLYEKKFSRSLGRKNRLADREFRKGQGIEKEQNEL